MSKQDASHRQKRSSSSATGCTAERPTLSLDIIGQPPSGVALGMPVETSILLSLRMPSGNSPQTCDDVDTSKYLAVSSLVADNRNGEWVPLEAGIMTGQKMFDSVHAIPEDCLERMSYNQPQRLVLGYFSFPGMLIRQSGTYRIRTTLIKMSASENGGASSIIAIDSEPIKVERRPTATPRRHQRVYNSFALMEKARIIELKS